VPSRYATHGSARSRHRRHNGDAAPGLKNLVRLITGRRRDRIHVHLLNRDRVEPDPTLRWILIRAIRG
jgi:hypothetical protein